MCNKLCHNIDGFTLVELVFTIIILSFTSLMLIPFFQAISHSPDPMLRQRAVALGQAMMDEIMAKKWDANSPNGGSPPICTAESLDNTARPSLNATCVHSGASCTTPPCASEIGSDGVVNRSLWDDVDDYHSFTETDTFSDQAGSTVSLNGYSRTVTVTYVPSNSDPVTVSNPVGSNGQGGTTTDSKRIVVSVSSPLNETFEFVTVVCNF